MKKEELIKQLNELKKNNKRNFTQTVDLIFTFKGLDLKKQDNQDPMACLLACNRT